MLCHSVFTVQRFLNLFSSFQKLYKIEIERLRNHFLETLNQRENQTADAGISEFPYDIEDYLKVPLAELLQYPYLLFNSELMSLFVSCLVLLIDNEKFGGLEEKHAGIYLLLANPCARVSSFILRTLLQRRAGKNCLSTR